MGRNVISMTNRSGKTGNWIWSSFSLLFSSSAVRVWKKNCLRFIKRRLPNGTISRRIRDIDAHGQWSRATHNSFMKLLSRIDVLLHITESGNISDDTSPAGPYYILSVRWHRRRHRHLHRFGNCRILIRWRVSCRSLRRRRASYARLADERKTSVVTHGAWIKNRGSPAASAHARPRRRRHERTTWQIRRYRDTSRPLTWWRYTRGTAAGWKRRREPSSNYRGACDRAVRKETL